VATPRRWPARHRPSARGAGWNHNCSAELAVSEPADHAIGRSRGGLTTKIHLLSDGRCRPLVLLLTAGNINDTTMLAALLPGLRVARPGPGRPRTRPDHLLADKGYSSRANRALLRRRGIPHTIPEPRDQQANRIRRGRAGGRPVGFDKTRYRHRNTVERGFCQLKHWRGLATRYDRHARNYLAGLTLAALLTWIP
jgi:transposase